MTKLAREKTITVLENNNKKDILCLFFYDATKMVRKNVAATLQCGKNEELSESGVIILLTEYRRR